MFKKIITAVLATLMLLIVLPTRVFAEEENLIKILIHQEKYILNNLMILKRYHFK